MKTRPILMKARSVRGILDKSKTQTRRLLRPQPQLYSRMTRFNQFVKWKNVDCKIGAFSYHAAKKSPHGPGDRLWVRETFSKELWQAASAIIYRADCPDGEYIEPFDNRKLRWTPSIFMPRWVSRITLEVLRVRVKQVQDISEKAAKSEGAIPVMHDSGGFEPWGAPCPEIPNYTEGFAILWDSIHGDPKPRYVTVDGKRAVTHYESYPWEDIRETREHRGKTWRVWGNPWVFVCEFRKLKSEVDRGE